jgi:hypothetical protein
MELFLNLCWLSLLVPAYLLWRRRISAPHRRLDRTTASTLAFVCVLGCTLVLLFPVISASDDLHAMRAEMEESSPGKRSVCQSAGENVSACHSRWQNSPAILGTTISLGLTGETWEGFSTVSLSLPAVSPILRVGRAPPSSPIG